MIKIFKYFFYKTSPEFYLNKSKGSSSYTNISVKKNFFIPDYDWSSLNQSLSKINSRLLTGSNAFISYLDGYPTGLLWSHTGKIFIRGLCLPLDLDESSSYFFDVYIHPCHRKSGHFSMLMKAYAMNCFNDDCKYIYFAVMSSNDPMVNYIGNNFFFKHEIFLFKTNFFRFSIYKQGKKYNLLSKKKEFEINFLTI